MIFKSAHLTCLAAPGVPILNTKRKIDQVAESSEQDERLTHRQRIDKPARANSFFMLTDEAPEWSSKDDTELTKRLLHTIELNTLEMQHKILSGCLVNPLPLAPYGDSWRVFEWFLFNPKSNQLEDFNAKIKTTSTNNQSSKVFLLYQVSGAGKTKLAYELSQLHYTVVIRFIDTSTAMLLLEKIFDTTAIPKKYNVLDSNERDQLPFFSLAITYAWIKAHIQFLLWYQNALANSKFKCYFKRELIQSSTSGT